MITSEEVSMIDKTEETVPAETKVPERIKIVDVTDKEKPKDLKFCKVIRAEFTTIEGDFLQGDFTIKRPTLMETAAIGTRCADLRHDKPLHSLSASTAALHEHLAVVSICVVKGPTWWNIDTFYDQEFLIRLYQEVTSFWSTFQSAVR